ncbi:hypothetical protein VM98_34725, partial [Streptomyces rubellomurinus subsp. indigoferus]
MLPMDNAVSSWPIPSYATATDGYVDARTLDARYSSGNLRGRVGFEPALRALLDAGVSVVVGECRHRVQT